jgi:hypothetical protein
MANEILCLFLLLIGFLFVVHVLLPISWAIDDYFSKKAAELRAARKRQ